MTDHDNTTPLIKWATDFYIIYSSCVRSLCQSCRSLSRQKRWPGCTTRRWIYLKQVFRNAYRQELGTKLSQKPWTQELAKIPDCPRRKAVAEFRLCVGHDCLGTHFHRIGIRPDPSCMLCSLHETMDRNHLGRFTALSSGTVWAILGGQDKNEGELTSSLLFLWLLLIIRSPVFILNVFNVSFSCWL